MPWGQSPGRGPARRSWPVKRRLNGDPATTERRFGHVRGTVPGTGPNRARALEHSSAANGPAARRRLEVHHGAGRAQALAVQHVVRPRIEPRIAQLFLLIRPRVTQPKEA